MSSVLKIALCHLDADCVTVIKDVVGDYIQHIEIIDDFEGADVVVSFEDRYNGPERLGYFLDKIEGAICQRHQGHSLRYRHFALFYSESRLEIQDQSYQLSERERDLMVELITAGDRGCSRETLLMKIWGYRSDLETHALETQIYRIRQKIEDYPEKPSNLITIDGGYRLS